VSVLVSAMLGLAFWHFAVLVPDRFGGGIIGALLAALGGALATGFLLPSPGVPPTNPPGSGRRCERSPARWSRWSPR
jgi:hypothetical protein